MSTFYIPVNQYRIPPGYYDLPKLVALLRRIAHRPKAVIFVADMMEDDK